MIVNTSESEQVEPFVYSRFPPSYKKTILLIFTTSANLVMIDSRSHDRLDCVWGAGAETC